MNTDALFSVAGKVVVITGGMGQLGRQFAVALTRRGAHVAVADVDVDPTRAGARFSDAPDGALMFVQADVTDRDSVSEALERLTRTWGVPHALINNAAIDTPPGAPAEENGPFESYPSSSFDRVMSVNVKGVVVCSQVIGGAMAAAGRGSVINISSIYGVVSPNQTIYEYRRQRGEEFYKPVGYAVSKSAILNLTRYLATYWAGRGVRVNTLTFAGVENNQDPAFTEAYCRHMPLGRMAREDEYNGAVIYLVSDASSYMTGSNMVIDGGWTAW